MSGSLCQGEFSATFFLRRSLSLSLAFSSLDEKTEKNSMAGRRYKAKLHILEEDDLASILTPAPPCKVPGLGTKGREEEEGGDDDGVALFSLLVFSAALFACESFRRRVRVLLVLCSSIKPRHRFGTVQCLPTVVRVWVFKGSRAGYDVDAFSTSAIELDCSTKKLFLSLSSKPPPYSHRHPRAGVPRRGDAQGHARSRDVVRTR